jgi:YD repeat-containing protein
MSTSGRQSVGHPVDVASGVMFNELTDCWLPGALPLSLRRFYSTALLGERTPFTIAPGWRHNFELELKEDLEGYTFTDEKGNKQPLPDRRDLLRQTGKLVVPSAGIELRGAGDVIELERYNAARGTKIVFRRVAGARTLRAEGFSSYPGVRLDFGFDRLGRLAQVTQTRSERRLLFAYDGLHRLREVTLERPSLLVLGFEYDARGRLIGVADSVGTKARYEYDGVGRILSEAKRGGSVYTFRYDVEGRCVYASGTDRFEERQLAYDTKARTTRVTDSHGHVTRYHYNDAGQIVEKETPLGALSQYEFDDAGRPAKQLEAGIVKGELTYDELGRLASASHPDGRKIELSYDEDHNIVRATDLAGRPWTYRFVHRRLVSSTNPLGQQWSYEMNDHGELVRVTDPLGFSRTFGYDGQGNLAWGARPSGTAWRYHYDELSRVVDIKDPLGGVRQRTYNSAGKLTSLRQQDGRVWRIEYDAADRPAVWILPDGTRASGRYNSCGQLIELRETDGSTRRFEWDTEPGRILAIEDGVGKRLSYAYNADGRPISRRNWDGREQQWEFNPLGLLTAITTTEGGRFTFEYDSSLQVAKRIDPDGQETEFGYDDGGFLIRAANSAGELTYERDLYGRATKETQDGITVENVYDALGRPIVARLPFGPEIRTEWTPDSLCAGVSIGGYRVEFDYDPLGREVARHFPGGGSYQQSYDPLGRVLEQAYHAPRSMHAGHIPGFGGIGTDFSRRFEYEGGMGRLSRFEDSRKGSFRAVHDQVGRLCAVLGTDGAASFYDFDPASNRTFKAVAPSGSTVRLDEVRRANAASGIRFDQGQLEAAGCDVEVSVLDGQDGGNRVVELRRADSRILYRLDQNGRLVEKQELRPQVAPRRWQYEWNGCGTLASVVTPDGVRWSYRYDALGRRISREGAGRKTRYVWNGQRLVHVLVDGSAHARPSPGLGEQRRGSARRRPLLRPPQPRAGDSRRRRRTRQRRLDRSARPLGRDTARPSRGGGRRVCRTDLRSGIWPLLQLPPLLRSSNRSLHQPGSNRATWRNE